MNTKIHVTWITVLLLTIATGIGLFLWQRQQNDDEVAKLSSQLAAFTNTSNNEAANTDNQSNPNLSATSSIEKLPVVVFEPAGLFTDVVIEEFRDQVINPITQYSADIENPVTAFLIETTPIEGEYIVNIIHDNGIYEGFLTGGSEAISWTPQCLDTCNLSETFKSRFPDIAQRVQ